MMSGNWDPFTNPTGSASQRKKSKKSARKSNDPASRHLSDASAGKLNDTADRMSVDMTSGFAQVKEEDDNQGPRDQLQSHTQGQFPDRSQAYGQGHAQDHGQIHVQGQIQGHAQAHLQGTKRKNAEQDQENESFRIRVGVEMVDITVGDDREPFTIHKAILLKRVPYFEKFTFNNGRWQEPISRKIHFEGESPESFDLVFDWVYSGRLRPLQKNPDKKFSWAPTLLYALAEKLDLSELMDSIMDELRHHHVSVGNLPIEDFIGKGYERSKPGSTLRRYLSDCLVYIIQSNSQAHKSAKVAMLMSSDEDLALDVVTKLKEGEKMTDPRQKPDCSYHNHQDGAVCSVNVAMGKK